MFSSTFTVRAVQVAGLALCGALAFISSRSSDDETPETPPTPDQIVDAPLPLDIEAKIEYPLDSHKDQSYLEEPVESPPAVAPIDFCGICGKPTELTCSKCRSVFYCGPEHSKEVRC